MASNIPAIGKWPDPKNDPIIYVENPIEADLPGHWIPLSVIKRHIEMRVDGRTTFPIFPAFPKYTKSTPKIKLSVKFTRQPSKNKHNEHSDTYFDIDQEDSSLIKAITNAADRLPSDETGMLVETKVQKQKYNEQKHIAKHNTSRIKTKLIKVATPSLNTRTATPANAKAHNERHTRVPAKPQSTGQLKVSVQAPHSTLTIAPDPPPTQASKPPPPEAPNSPLTKAPNQPPTIAPNQPTKAPKPPPTESPNPLPTEAPNLPTKAPKPSPTEARNPPSTEVPNPTSTKAPTSPPTQAPSGTTIEATKLTTTPTGDPFY